MTVFSNAKIIFEDRIREGCVITENGKIKELCDRYDIDGARVIDCTGLYLSPGFADIHVHGGGGCSAMSEKPEDIIKMCEAHARCGTTSLVPTTLAAPIVQLQNAMRSISAAADRCSLIRGIHLEGPFLSMKMKGAQSPDSILEPTKENIDRLLDDAKDLVMMGAAPEKEGGFALGETLQERGIVASIAHSDAGYELAEEALRHGYSDITHLYSACSAMRKNGIFREVGVVEAGLSLDGYTTQFIADLRHLPYGALRLIYKVKGAQKAYCISDGLEYAALDMAQGTVVTQENGLSVILEDEVMKLADRSCLAGSVATSCVLVRNLWKRCGIPLYDVVRMASLTPLTVIGQAKTKGRIAEGFDADLVLFDEDVNIVFVTAGGKTYRDLLTDK